MAFGQQAGPPATGRQVQELLDLLQAAGHADFREARGPMGFNQRQAGGRFTRDEAAELIERLQEESETGGQPPESSTTPDVVTPRARTVSPSRPPSEAAARTPSPTAAAGGPTLDRVVRNLPTDRLAAELERRGWMVIAPLTPDVPPAH
jgi:hypothetical protein